MSTPTIQALCEVLHALLSVRRNSVAMPVAITRRSVGQTAKPLPRPRCRSGASASADVAEQSRILAHEAKT